MEKKLSQDDINNLLSGLSEPVDKRKELNKSFQKNGNQYNKEIIKELLQIEFQEREQKGLEIQEEFLQKKISREEAIKKSAEYGHGIWWGAESSWSVEKVNEFHSRKLSNDRYEINVFCSMSYLSSHIVYEENGKDDGPIGSAEIKLVIDSEFIVFEFNFSWE